MMCMLEKWKAFEIQTLLQDEFPLLPWSNSACWPIADTTQTLWI